MTFDIWQGRKVLERKKFDNNGTDFSSYNLVSEYLRSMWFEMGSMQRDAPIAFSKRVPEGETIEKWRYITPEDLTDWVDGVILPFGECGLRNGGAEVLFFGEVCWPVSVPTAKDDIEDFKSPSRDEGVLYEVSDRIAHLVNSGELGEFIDEGNTRQCYQHAKNPDMIIKIPRPGYEVDADSQSMNEFETYMHELENLEIVESWHITRMAECYWDRRTRILVMEKVRPIHGTKNLGLNKNGVARVYDSF